MSAILGLNAFHPDASACLLIDGKLVGAVAEERLGPREKHSGRFPEYAIRWLLADNGLRLADVTHVAIARQPGANVAAKLRHVLSNPKTGARGVQRFLSRHRATGNSLSNLAEICGEDSARMSYKIHAVEHHLAHIASAYYLSPFDELTAGFSYDGSGDFASAMSAHCEGTSITVTGRATLPHSLGHFYTAMCQFIGFDLFGEEYKVMGLAPYGTDTYAEEMARVVQLDGTDWFRLAGKYFDIGRGFEAAEVSEKGLIRLGSLYSAALERDLGPARKRDDPVTQREMDIARSTQVRFEDAAMNALTSLQAKTPVRRLAMAGGCGLNGVMNARIQRDTAFTDCFHQPASSDDGTALGAAYHCWHMGLGRTERFQMAHAFWGPEYSDAAIRAALDSAGLTYRSCDSIEQAADRAAKLIADGAVLGWYQGRSEWGPRALGNRSILGNPAIKDMKATINAKIKKREGFRPFAPSVLAEDAARYFEQDVHSPFMMHVVKFRPEWREVFPAVNHVDGTGRLQTVAADSNPLYHRLISAVKSHTGHGIVLNTSFNENEPVVDRPEQAIACYLRTDMDALVLGRHMVEKVPAP